MLRFTGIEPIVDPGYKTTHVRPYQSTLAPVLRERLEVHFKPSADRLRALLEDDLPE
jgi:hypothetical protein